MDHRLAHHREPHGEHHNEHQRQYYNKAPRRTITHTESPFIQRQIDEVLRVADLPDGARVLDAGCGMGRHSVLLAERGYEVEGLELSPHLLELMRRQSRRTIPTYCADLANPPPALNNGYDAVVGFFILHHLPDLEAAFAGVARMTRPGGPVVFIEPNPANPLYYVQIGLTPGMKWSAERGILNMRRERIFQAMSSAGLSHPAVSRFGFLPPFLRNRSFGGAVDRAVEHIKWLEPRCRSRSSARGNRLVANAAAPDFTADRLQRLIEIDRDHFWFRGRRTLVRRLLEQYVGTGGKDVLDLGPGGGSLSLSLGDAGFRVIAIDLLPAGLRRLRAHAPTIRAIQSTGERLPLTDDCCDAALALDVLEHLNDESAVAELHRILRPGGWLIVTVPAFGWLWSYRDVAAGHKRRYSRQMLTERLEGAGFTLEHIGYYQCVLFPLTVLARAFGRRSATTRDWEDQPYPAVNAVFSFVNQLEVAVGTRVPWPFGSSLYAVARRAQHAT